ncbi:DUF1553 domain-containing protein [Stieleria varia]|uniref:Planctomycete cytochrome C n=1 Tax=Stieleria varia TaxID=2528005 RepID=A0A5C6AMQ2_9BACT|nr:DUF1553 domain-containing protein [Stieleria varia]TWU00940.1 hypothetical protein Pla52n_43100 [Stieleria varia]
MMCRQLRLVAILVAVISLLSRPCRAIDFTNDVIPLLTKHGCNGGACHGAAIGRGGFKLSLYGGNPESDYTAIAQQLGGRRINLAQPDASLIVLKPSEQLQHGGEQLFASDSESAQLLTRWIASGAPLESKSKLHRVEISPGYQVIPDVGDSVNLQAVAHYDDGMSRDVTRWTVFHAEDAAAVELTYSDSDNVQIATVLRRGRHIVIARYLTQVLPIELIVPLSGRVDVTKTSVNAEPRRNFIDDEISRTLATLGLPLSPDCDDATFLRRASLDLTGRLPSAIQVQAFASDSSPEKRSEWIESFLSSKEFDQYWTFQLSTWLRLRAQRGDVLASQTYRDWIAEQVSRDVSYRQIARDLILASGDSQEQGPPNFYRTVAGPREQAEYVSELFMGSRLRCANCHNHPLDRWTQDDYHGLAAIFAKLETERFIKPKPSGRVIHPGTMEDAIPKIPGGEFLDFTGDNRQQLADWITDADNPYFAKAVVNRLWKHMMGRGLVEPVDDFRATNPATHPELLSRLAADFVANGYRLRHTIGLIARSRAYARDSRATSLNKDDDRYLSHAIRRRLSAEVMADAISDVLGVADVFGEQPPGTRAVNLMDPQTPSTTLDILGRCGRNESCDGEVGTSASLSQTLHLMNGELLNQRIGAEDGRLQQLLKLEKEPIEIIRVFYTVALSRSPTADEVKHWQKQIDATSSDSQRHDLLEDFVWSLLTCDEFVTNH